MLDHGSPALLRRPREREIISRLGYDMHEATIIINQSGVIYRLFHEEPKYC